MRSKRRIETTIETHEVWVVRRRAKLSKTFCCAQCPGRAAMFTPEEAASLASVSQRTIYRWVEDGRLHFSETPDGGLLICQASLLAGATAFIP